MLCFKKRWGLKFAFDFNLFFSNHQLDLNMLLDKEYFYK